ncbi:mitochondrial hypoxia responsive domain protein [Talaromyces marneffei ATCC 18224]|uniref:Respiratory supercomplex factor 1-A, mitochondrial n=1 Tax=Talaromyces marneffei (strain ATCC 18224 / CBS 334.59 / QM 7333) TaxID=441960 RepID=RCF1A_TALMQ|nr:RecName: Full=Respiratory supercomplex factor 1-A, mitochondrial [Talaromyces marneffei ATCC 18224]EEA22864.1 mitochondrial hypoxia responsive domain protein [Talaromyces marneffei ATCC 18224]
MCSDFEEETSIQKFKRRLKEEPLIPLGCAATCYALYRAYRSGKAKDSVEMNRMFRARIYAQFFTLLAVVAGGMYYKTERKQRREFEKKVEERKAQEKRDAWLRELEARDKEDKGWKERHAAVSVTAKKETEGAVDKNVNQAPTEEVVEKRGTGILDAVKALVQGKKD